MSTSKAKGTSAESAVVKFLQRAFWPYAERRALSGGQDKGDITGTPGIAWEVKSAKTLCIPAWLRETETERVNAKADYAVLVIKPVGVGLTRTDQWYALMDQEKFGELLDEKPFGSWVQAATITTTTRKLKPAVALELVRLRAQSWGQSLYWVNYAGFVLTDLRVMCELVNDAGFGGVR